MNTNIPDDLMDNVERKLRKHVKNRRKNLHRAVAALVGCAVILPTSAFAYAKYIDSIPYKQEIDLARQHNNITKINKVFKYKNVTFTIKEIVADDTGMEVIYDVSDPKYSIDRVNFSGGNNNFISAWGYSAPQEDENSKEKAFNISVDKSGGDYMENNPIKIKINSISYKASNSLADKIKSMVSSKSTKVDWSLKMNVPMQATRIIPINRNYKLDIGTLKIKDLKEGILQTIIEYDFTPSSSDIQSVMPIFSIRLDKKYTSNVEKKQSNSMQGEDFESIYYKKVNEIGIRLIGARVNYEFVNPKTYEVKNDKLPMEFDYNGDKFKIVSMKDKGKSTEYAIEYSKKERTYDDLNIVFGNGSGGQIENGTVEYKDKAANEKIYKSLIRKIPEDNIKSISDFNTGAISTKVTTEVKGEKRFKVSGAYKRIIYDEDEIVIDNPFKN
ncbi:DUF4179 domain-containing protein [Clostridium neuense]|uniref:DUF4179 domain-containing protein n=1 Tax=Clostridium neuense TaxID=1728934 RepID=A0ABW8TAR6_9CLOT